MGGQELSYSCGPANAIHVVFNKYNNVVWRTESEIRIGAQTVAPPGGWVYYRNAWTFLDAGTHPGLLADYLNNTTPGYSHVVHPYDPNLPDQTNKVDLINLMYSSMAYYGMIPMIIIQESTTDGWKFDTGLHYVSLAFMFLYPEGTQYSLIDTLAGYYKIPTQLNDYYFQQVLSAQLFTAYKKAGVGFLW